MRWVVTEPMRCQCKCGGNRESNSAHQSRDQRLRRAADLAIDSLPSYMGEWIADTLIAPQSISPLRQHQDQIANDIINFLE